MRQIYIHKSSNLKDYHLRWFWNKLPEMNRVYILASRSKLYRFRQHWQFSVDLTPLNI